MILTNARRTVLRTLLICLAVSLGSAGVSEAQTVGSRFVPVGGKLVPSDASGSSGFGTSVALSSNGDTLLVGGPDDTNGDGAAWVYARVGPGWQEVTKLTDPVPSSDGMPARFGSAVALSGNGEIAMVAGVDGRRQGTVVVFTRGISGAWSEWTTLSATGLQSGAEDPYDAGASFGSSLALSADGTTAIVGADTDTCFNCGAAVVFTLSGTSWTQQGAPLRPSDPAASDASAPSDAFGAGGFGSSVVLDGDGGTALVGDATDAHSCGVSCVVPGAVWTFTRQGQIWSQRGVKIAGGLTTRYWGTAEALSADGSAGLMWASPQAVALRLSSATTAATTTALSQYPVSGDDSSQAVALSGDGDTALIAGGGCTGDEAEPFRDTSAGWAAEPGLAQAGAETDAYGSPAVSVGLSEDGGTACSLIPPMTIPPRPTPAPVRSGRTRKSRWRSRCRACRASRRRPLRTPPRARPP